MAGGKETPRQKMIGMMYLVLTCLLAMNVSKDILKGFVTVDESLNRTNKNFSENINRVMDGFKVAKESNPSAVPYYEKAIEVVKMNEDLFNYIEKLKAYLRLKTEQVESQQIADTLHLRFCDKKDNYDIPTYEMIGDEPSTPKDGEWSAKELKGKIKSVHDKLQSMLDAMQKQKNTQFLKDDYDALKKKISTIDPVDPNEKEDDVPVTWETLNFFHLPLAAVMTNLSKIQSDIKNVEAEVVNQFAAASGKVSVKFNQLAARVVAPSSYIQAGQPYTADIFIAASSDAFKEDNMQILLGVDSSDAAKGGNGSGAVKIVNGIGKYEVGTSGQGDQEYKGVIKFKKPTGEYDYYPFNGKYTVAAPSVAVSPDKMNLFYIGVPNPVTISAAGVAPSNLVVSASGGGVRIAQKGGGKFEVMASTPGDCNISVSAKTADGTKPQGPPIKFRVKRIPDPVAKLGGKPGYGTLEFPKLQLATIGGIVAEVPGFDFDAKFVVTQFVMTAVIKGNLKEMSASGNSLSGEMKGVLSQLGPGGKVFFENIKAKGPDGSVRTLSNVTIKVK